MVGIYKNNDDHDHNDDDENDDSNDQKKDDDDHDDNDKEDIIIVKFYSVPRDCLPGHKVDSNGTGRLDVVVSPDFGYVPTDETREEEHRRRRKQIPMPPLPELLTVLVTTSPIRSNPSTELIERIFGTFRLGGGTDLAIHCRKVIVCDGYRETVVVDTKTGTTNTARYGNAKQAMRNGIVTSDQRSNYERYKRNLRQLCDDAGPESPFRNTTVHELTSRHGYGFAVRHVLQQTDLVTTPYVIVIQHDRTFMRPTPIHETVAAMWNNLHIKYVGMTMRYVL
jgi:hypothetical protein